MKKIILATAIVSLAIMLSLSFANAALDADITIGNAQINHGASQQMTATANKGGMGILIVIQPATGQPWANFLNNHPLVKALWNSLPNSMKMQINNAIGGKIVSYALVNFGNGGGSKVFSFPADFKGINGVPSTTLMGKYKVLFAFISNQVSNFERAHCQCFCLFQVDFDCGSWFVVPEVPLGTVLPLVTSLLALPVFKLISRKRQP